MPKTTQATSSDGIMAVSLALQIFEKLAHSDEPLRVTDLAQALGTSKTRVFRYLRTLIGLGYVIQDPQTERYGVGIRLALLATALSARFDLLKATLPILRQVRDTLGQTVVMSFIEDGEIYPVQQVNGSSMITFNTQMGMPLGLHNSAQGKLSLAYGPPELLERVLQGTLKKVGARTIVDPAQLRAEIEGVRERGWAVAPSETLSGLNALAMPIFTSHRKIVATLGLLGSIDEIPALPSAHQIDTLRAAAEELAHRLQDSPLMIGAAR
ncbi:DNA-binding IclR family transcriptional regulator [Rhodoligotrophos appendicifer]|uniref:IclR family transcriptional regulator n=1 Tax=Rhodoligotrophos appendicifer TaxID=987056 RepID=UPI0011862975|nr:IclR family transcriptional regulator [Rhodoligotrophos appendicifer]